MFLLLGIPLRMLILRNSSGENGAVCRVFSLLPLFSVSKLRAGHCCLLFFIVGSSLGALQGGVPLAIFAAAGKKKGKTNAEVLGI